MKRRSHDRAGQAGQRVDRLSSGRRGIKNRLLTLGTLAMTAIIVLTACGPEVDKPYSTTSPASPNAEDIQSLYKLIFWLALIVFIGVQFAIIYTALRFRRSRTAADRPAQIHGNKRLEIIWTVIPAVVLLVILIPTITTLYAHDADAEEGDLVIDVYGKQWWWEIHYRENANGDDLGVVTGNEIRLPVGQEAIIRLHSNNVIHSFWVPRLAGKMDLIPGHETRLSITPTEVGDYYGECAEFCGAQHAWMRFQVVVEPQAEFYEWINAWRTGHPGTTNQEAELPPGVTRAPEAFNVCLSCHQVNGLEGSGGIVGIEAPANIGPNLTLLACRDTLAAGMLINNEENLRLWIDRPGEVKPGNYMADVITPGLIREQFGEEGFDALIEYLMSLQPAGGCDEPIGYGDAPLASPVASPGASPVASPIASPAAISESGGR